MSIQLFVPKFRVEECLVEIRECLEKGWTGLGFKTVAFEDAWKTYTGLPHAHFLNSNTVGLQLALEVLGRRLGWEEGDEVITTPLTFVSSNHAVVYNGFKAVFADVDDSLCLDPQSIAAKITDRTRAVMFVGLGGNTGRYAEVLKLCRERGIAMILDAAHMAGTRVGGRHVGYDADATVFSFQAVKNLPTADSGMICFANEEDDAEVRKLSWLGINKDTYARTAAQGAYKWMYDVERVGYKFHGNSIMAAIGLVQLRYLDQDNAYRRQLASWYRGYLSGAKNIKLIPMTAGIESATHLFQVRVSNRDELMLALNENAVYPGVHYRDNTEYTMYSYGKGTCPNAAQASSEILSLPMHMGVTHADVKTIAELILKYAK
ncbi:DegT/DnrJ/EryC1/StrS family aminotransferase [Dyella kyungheensis]|uniref:DegT/DnrJ/EryC1/StrS family aminotransferase n=1 Tax=Dyella kyungheensis TaxID=1242174 RepID=A0ABS2JU96_9GAMM|nr:DegT/DnrJ/EryC1/StrS family aminotransferase [Dyella kyungheensis]MBM7121643.1 DegT/DnrJ/EryC1/StrS family aminotransferase [Dyella kyungheensis]